MHINKAINMAIKSLNEGRPQLLPNINKEIDDAIETLVNLKTVEVELCHCSRPVVMNLHIQFLDEDNNLLKEFGLDDLTTKPYEIPENTSYFRVFGKIWSK